MLATEQVILDILLHYSRGTIGNQIGEPGLMGRNIHAQDNLEVEITTVADGIKKQTYTLPVKLEYFNDDV
ncbi:hypothetical protein ES703_116203 [subsurface metagenome]